MMMMKALALLVATTRVVGATTPAPSPFPTRSAECESSTSCEAGYYCDKSYSLGQCNVCSSSDGSPPETLSCIGNDTNAEECINTCFPTFKCSENSPCTEEGLWCNYQLGDSGVCSTCKPFTNKYPGQCISFINDYDAAQEACKSTCFDSCSSQADCEEGTFCTLQNTDGSGYCTNCSFITGDAGFTSAGPHYCQNNTHYFEWTPEGEEACLGQCFSTCTESSECPNGFCNRVDGPDSESGYCDSCTLHTDDPAICFAIVVDSASAKECASACFGECTLSEGCEEGSFCALDDSGADPGYCMNCTNLYGRLDFCFFRNATDAGKEHCASTCFGECSKDNPCSEGNFCTFQNGDDGYCSPCSHPLNAIDCMKLSPEGQESCVTSCYEVCSANQTCPDYKEYSPVFCDYQFNSSSGACADCPRGYRGPEGCKVWDVFDNTTTLTDEGQESCTATCFRPCNESSAAADCGPDHFCSPDGYCQPIYTDSNPGGDAVVEGGASILPSFLGRVITFVALFTLF